MPRWPEKQSTQKLTKEQFFVAFTLRYQPVLGFKVCQDIVESARSVEGGFCWSEIMWPYAFAMYGDNLYNAVEDWW